MQITHITIDFWNTIYKSNPDFAKHRNDHVRQYFIDSNAWPSNIELTVGEIGEVYQNTKALVNQLEFDYGKSIPVPVKHAMFFGKLGIDTKYLTAEYFAIQASLFKKYPPLVMHKDTIEIISDLSKEYAVTILSNTGMVSNSLLRNFIIDGEEEYQFSDDSVFCKPSQAFFTEYSHSMSNLKQKQNWLHIGDDYERDITPALTMGVKAFHLTKPEDWLNIKTLLL